MAAETLFGGLLLLLWLTIGAAGWTAAAARRPARANFRALGAALIAAVVLGALPALAGWRTLPALLLGLVLSAAGATSAALRLT